MSPQAHPDYRRQIEGRAKRLLRLVELNAPPNVLANEAHLVFMSGCSIRKVEGDLREPLPLVGQNGCLTIAAQALEFLAEHPRPVGGEDRFNSMHCHQLSEELKRTIRPRDVLEEDIAFNLWQGEAIRATGKPRLTDWDEVATKDKEKYLHLARYVLDHTILRELIG